MRLTRFYVFLVGLILSLDLGSFAEDFNDDFREERAAKEFSSFGFSVEPLSVVVARNDSARLDCATHGSSKVKIEWRKESVTVRPDGRRQILANGSLVISKVVDSRGSAFLDQTDEGDYQCVAVVDDVGTFVSRKANIKVATLSRFEAQPTDRSVDVGSTLMIPCVVDGTPQPVFSWYRDGNVVDLSIAGRLTLIPKTGSLEIQNVTGTDEGVYYCKAVNADKPRSSDAGKISVVRSASSAVPKQPVFEAKPQSVVVVEGSSATLECAANGHPHPKIQWLKNQKFLDLTLNPRFKVVGQGSLVISNVQAGDEGQFTCRAMNSEDSSDSSATVVVHTPPSFVTLPLSIVAKETEDVHFECEAEGKPGPSVLWMKNGEILTPSDYFQIEGTRLKINGLVVSDLGVFQCLAENTAGTAQASAQLIVERAGKNRSSGASSADLFGKDKKPADSHSLPTVETPETSDRGGTDGNNRGPSEPIQIRSIFVSSRYVTLRWNPPTNPGGDIIAYSIYYKQEGSARERVVNSSAPNLEEVTINLLLPSTVYHFRVVAYNKFGPGKSGGPLKVVTNSAKAVPGKVRNLKAEAVSPNSIVVTWEPPIEEGAAVAIYKLFYSRVDEGADPAKADSPEETDEDLFGNMDETEVQLTTTSYDFHDLDKFTTYTFRVEGHSRNGPGASSDLIQVRTLSDVPSGPPLNVTAEPATSKSVVINWSPPAKDEQNGIITGYKVRYKKKFTNDSSAQMHTFTTDGSSRSHVVADLSSASVYAVRVAAVTVNGTGPWSPWIHASTYAKDLDESQVPGAPAQLQLLSKGKSILIAWVPPADNSIMIRGYKIGWGLGGVPDVDTVKLIGAMHKSHKLENLKPGRPYLVSVRAFNNIGEGYPSYETATTGDAEPSVTSVSLLPPVGLRAETLSSTAILLKWVDQDLISGVIGEMDGAKISDNRRYIVQYSAKYLNGKSLNQTVKETEAKLEKLRPFTTYEFSVKVVKGKAESIWSMSAYNTTLEAAPGSAPTDISVMQIEQTDSVVITWKPPRLSNGNIIGYSIFWTDDSSKSDRDWTITTVKDDRTTATLENLRNGAVYHFKIQAMTEKGWGPMSNATRYKTHKSLFPADSASAGTRSVNGNRYNSDEDTKVGGIPMNVIIVTVVVGVGLAIVLIAVGVGVYFCKRQSARKRAGYQAGVKKAAAHKEVQNPPDLWIHHHENLDRRNSGKNGDSQMGSVQDLRIREPSPPLPIVGMEMAEREVLLNSSRPLSCVRSVDESVSSTGTIGRRVGWAMPMVQNSPISQSEFNDGTLPNGTLSRARVKAGSNTDLQPSSARSAGPHQLPQYGSVVYTGQKHHQSPYGSGFVGPPPIAQTVPLPQVPSGAPVLVHMGTNSSDVFSHSSGSNPSRLSNPLSSFVSAPPPPSTISPNPQRPLSNGRNINNNGDVPSYPYAAMSTSVPGQSHQRKPAGIVIGTKSPALNLNMSSTPRFSNDPYVSRRELEMETLPHSHSTEELNAQMKSLDSLMKDLNDISQNEFDVL